MMNASTRRRSIDRSFVRSIVIHSFVHSFVRSFIHAFIQYRSTSTRLRRDGRNEDGDATRRTSFALHSSSRANARRRTFRAHRTVAIDIEG